MLIEKAMRRLLTDSTCFVIVQRLSTIYDADEIVVMSHGEIAEIGTHKELLEGNGVYADSYHSKLLKRRHKI